MFYWRRAAPALYHLRDHEGLGPALGGLKRAPSDGASVYTATFESDDGEVSIWLRSRGSHNTVIKQLEDAILLRLPDATFQRIGF